MEVSASDFARMCGVSSMAICKMIKAGTLVRNAGPKGKKLDTDNIKNRAYLERKQSELKTKLETQTLEASASFAATENIPAGEALPEHTATVTPPQEKTKAPPRPAPAPDTQAKQKPSLQQLLGQTVTTEKQQVLAAANKSRIMMDMTIRQLLRAFGTIDNIEQFSKIQRDLSAADEREQKTQERRLLQIPKDFVVNRLFAFLDDLMNQLLDVPEAICDQVIAVSLAGGNDARVNVMHILSDNLTKCISGAKEHVQEELNMLKGKYDKAENVAIDLRDQLEEMREVG